MANGNGFEWIGAATGKAIIGAALALCGWIFATTQHHAEDIAVIKTQMVQMRQDQADTKSLLDKVHGDVQVLLSRKP